MLQYFLLGNFVSLIRSWCAKNRLQEKVLIKIVVVPFGALYIYVAGCERKKITKFYYNHSAVEIEGGKREMLPVEVAHSVGLRRNKVIIPISNLYPLNTNSFGEKF